MTCGYSLLAFDGQGRFRWQRWPAGNASLGEPLIDREGRTYLSGDGRVLAVSDGGDTLWSFDAAAGFPHPRDVPRLGLDAAGTLLFVSYMAGLHAPTDSRGVRRYYEHRPPELVVLDRNGRLRSRRSLEDGDPEKWPSSTPGVNGANRIAWR